MRLFGAMALSLLASACVDGPRENIASLEDAPLYPGVVSPDIGFTFAQTRNMDGLSETLLVVDFDGEDVTAINLTAIGAKAGRDIFEATAGLDPAALRALTDAKRGAAVYRRSELLSAAGEASRHVASGTNFPEHAKETLSDQVFNFPKFGQATPPVTTVALRPGVLLDYEVEICVRFDRDIASPADFDAARKGFFLCGDFTDRAMLSRLVDPDNFDSGTGFTDSKSAADFFPTGPFLVEPHDWKRFVANERFATYRNGDIKQDARGGEMSLDFRQLTEKVLSDTTSTRFIYRGQPRPLVLDHKIAKGQTLMSGTPEGVIFMPPTGGDIAGGVARYIATFGFLREPSAKEVVVNAFLDRERKSNRFLQPGEVVHYASASMGAVTVTVVEDNESTPSP